MLGRVSRPTHCGACDEPLGPQHAALATCPACGVSLADAPVLTLVLRSPSGRK